MHTPQLFSDILIIILAALPVVYLCFRLKLPVLVGLMLAGIAIGPYSLGLIKDLEGVEVLAEVGVMLLLFTIGLEFSLARLHEMRRLVLIGGGLQVIGTIAATASISYFLGRELNQAIFFGFLVALSSTAIVLKSYVDRNEVDSPHGKVGVGILLFQDICIVLMLLMVPLLADSPGESSSVSGALLQLGISLGVLVSVVVAAWFLIPILLRQVVSLRSPEVFILSVVFIALGMSWVTSQLGLSLALGAFIAGVVLADSEYNHQAISEVLPFRDVFNSLFFVSIGMLLSLSILIANIEIVIELIAAIIIGKALLVWAVVRLLGFPQRVSAMAALGLAQIGEFSFVLARSGRGAGLLPDAEYQSFLAASIISMIATPFMIAAAPRFGFWIQAVLKDGPRHNVDNAEDADIHLTSSGGLQQHVVIVGYGLNGRNLARVLRTVGVPYCVLDLNADAVKRGKAKGEKINFGDATRREVLQHANIDKAAALVLAMSDPHAARRTVGQARALNSDVHIIVRTRYVSEITELFHLGANEVIPEEFETSIEIFARVLHRFGFARNVIELQIENIRKQGYEMLRSPSPLPVTPGALIEALDPADTTTVRIPDDSPVIGKGLGALDIRGKTGVTVIAVLRKGETKISPGANYILQPGDTVVLLGAPDRIEKALNIFQPDTGTRNAEGVGGFNP
jgi:CPA2 family monovalent cation:H+ antiporter-2